jgi:DNA mismatch repair protein MutS
VSRGRADARDLRSLKATLDAVPDVLSGVEAVDGDATRLDELGERIDPVDDARDPIERAIRPDPPVELTEGGVIREGFDDELDDLRATEREGRAWVAELEARERERTGIDSLSVGHNQVHGYYIEVTDPNLDRVPDDYTRRQTLKNAERFYTPALKRREDEILGAAERADTLEYERFCEVRESVAAETDRLQAVADALAELDALATLAAVAVDRNYARPTFHDGGIEVEAGRHPVVEATQDRFVPNDATLPPGSVSLVTGPNMSGKSTYMRQVALIVVLAQMGSFVPADAATLPVVDRVFTRVGASDDIAGGQSTFMREMAELTAILHEATPDSLVLLDEVGRGTSTADGRAIARATAEFLHDEVGATTLFATHYHDLTGLAAEYERVRNLHFAAEREGSERPPKGGGRPTATGDVTFLHRVADGPASSSYGVEVARMAGVPDPVVERSRALVEGTNGHDDGMQVTLGAVDGIEAGEGTATDDGVAATLRDADLARTTPIEALNLLAELKDRVEES